MNPLTNMKNVLKLSEQDLQSSTKTSWHNQYSDSAWIFVGGLPYDLTEGDIICIFSQYGEIVNINLIRDKDTGKSKGFCFICYEDQRSTILSVDNLNGIKILNRTIRVDHVANYKVPKEGKKTDDETKQLYNEGCAPKSIPPKTVKTEPPVIDARETLADQIDGNLRIPTKLPIYSIKEEKHEETDVRKEKKSKKKKKEKKKKRLYASGNSSESSSSDNEHKKHDKRQKLKHKNHKRNRSRSKDRDKDNNREKPYNSKRDSEAYVPKRYRK